MQTSRREFFKVSAVVGVAATVFGFDLKPAYAQLNELTTDLRLSAVASAVLVPIPSFAKISGRLFIAP